MMPQRFLELLRPIRADLERYLRGALRDRGESEDALQEAVIRAFRDFAGFSEGTSFRAFVFAYAVREVLNRNRRTQARAGRETLLDFEPADPAAELEDEGLHERFLEAPASVLDRCDDAVRAAFDGLRPIDRTVFLLASVGGLRAREIGQLTGLPVGTVLSIVFRVRLFLRRRLASVAAERGLIRGDARP